MSSPAVRALGVSLVALAGLLGAWFVPPLAIVVVWPLLFVVPGWLLISACRARIDVAGRIGLAVVVSVALSTHLVHWLSLALGEYDRVAVFVAAGGLAASLPAAAWFQTARLPRPATLRRAWPGLAVAGAATIVVGLVLGVGLWRETDSGVVSGGWNWSDLGVHLSIAQSLNAGANFPPEVPYFARAPLVYHWFADFHAAIGAEAAGVFAVPAMIVQSSVMAGTLALLVYSLAGRLLGPAAGRRGTALAALLATFAGGMGWIRLVGDVSNDAGAPLDLIAATSYDNQWLTGWPYFRIPSVLGTGLLAHRATTVGLPMLVAVVLLVVVALPTARRAAGGWRDRPPLLAMAGLVGALLAPFHFFYFPLAPALVLAYVVASGRLLERAALRNAAAFLAPFVLAVPHALAPALQARGSGDLRWVAGWQEVPIASGALDVLFFYATNLGVPFVVALVAILARRTPHRAFLAAWLAGALLIPNVVQVSAVAFDMNKYFQAMWIAVALLAAGLLRRWPLPAVACVLVLSLPSPLLVAAWHAGSDLQALSRGELDASRWVAANTPPDAVFVTDGWVNALTDAAGRRRLTTFGAYVENLGYDPAARIADVHDIYCAGDASRSADLMRRYGAEYLVDGARPPGCSVPTDFATHTGFRLVYPGPSPRIWQLAAEPRS